jgi:uncharacterized protein YndB with AHSA1/START domain
MLWQAWTDPEIMKKWWGPMGFTAPVIDIDLRVGGKYLSCMRSAAGQNFWSTGRYLEIVPGERLAASDSFADEHGKVVPASYYGLGAGFPLELSLLVTFEDNHRGSRFTMKYTGIPAGKALVDARSGWNQSFDKLAATLKTMQAFAAAGTIFTAEPGKQETIITRVFNASREQVFRLYTNPKLIPEWWGPARLTTTVDKMELKPGGLWHFLHRDAAGNVFAFHGYYHGVRAPESLAYSFEFEGAPGHVALETVTFEEQGGKTLMTDRSVFQSLEDRNMMLQSGMEAGATESVDRLAALLERHKAPG